jgi:tRNA(adenine34) deaminase
MVMIMRDDFERYFMEMALEEARLARKEGEVPVGAVITYGNEILARAHNRPRGENDPTAHAEILAMRRAAKILGNYRLTGATLYVTIEPCVMCAGAIVHARIGRLVFGARDPKSGGAVSLYGLLSDGKLNHGVELMEGVCGDACAEILSGFFREKRITSPPASTY